MPRTGVSRLYSTSIFSFVRTLHTVLHSGCANLHSHQQYRSRAPLLPTAPPNEGSERGNPLPTATPAHSLSRCSHCRSLSSKGAVICLFILMAPKTPVEQILPNCCRFIQYIPGQEKDISGRRQMEQAQLVVIVESTWAF